MAGRGPAPKDASERRNRNPKLRGEWVDLPRSNSGKVPAMPVGPEAGWAPGTAAAWNSWWSDPASLMWGPGDLEALRQLVVLHHEFEINEKQRATLAREVRQRQDDLGLSLKGKQDRRWRVVADELEEARAEKPKGSRYGHLKAVAGGAQVEGT